MRVSREQVVENRRRILAAAGQLFRERGFENVSVAEVMKAAGLTHGGFYGHFASKEDLIAQTLASALEHDTVKTRGLGAYAAEYLSDRHRGSLGAGCTVAALGAESVRQSPAARAAMRAGFVRQIETLSATAQGADPAARRQAAIASWAAMVGGLILARAIDDPDLSGEVLAATRAWIEAGSERSAEQPSAASRPEKPAH